MTVAVVRCISVAINFHIFHIYAFFSCFHFFEKFIFRSSQYSNSQFPFFANNFCDLYFRIRLKIDPKRVESTFVNNILNFSTSSFFLWFSTFNIFCPKTNQKWVWIRLVCTEERQQFCSSKFAKFGAFRATPPVLAAEIRIFFQSHIRKTATMNHPVKNENELDPTEVY